MDAQAGREPPGTTNVAVLVCLAVHVPHNHVTVITEMTTTNDYRRLWRLWAEAEQATTSRLVLKDSPLEAAG
jgi:hypothetical protein